MENIETQGFSFDLPKGNSSIIKVIGVGGGGNNALKYMYQRGIHGVDFVICNTDSQTLDNNPVANKVQLGLSMTEGLGAGADPEVGEKAAIESIDDIKASIGQNTKMVFITAGMGGGTGTGAAPVIAKVAKEMGILTVGIVTVPFSFEGKRRLDQAEVGLEKLKNNVDSLIVINNDKLRQLFGNLGFKQGFSKADEVLTNAAKGMAEVITGYFDVNIDFRDAKSVLQNSGTALMSTGIASGENKAEEAVRKALDSPLLNDNKIAGAKNVLLLIRSGNEEATMDEIGIINDYIQKEAGNTADIIFGVGTDDELGDAISVLVIATGFANEQMVHTGITEKITISLEDKTEKSKRRESPFKNKSEQATPEVTKPQVLRLDDEDAVRPTRETPVLEAKIPPIEDVASILDVERVQENEGELAQQGIDLFSYSNYEDEEDFPSFSFEVEEPIHKEEPKVQQVVEPVVPNVPEVIIPKAKEEQPVEIKFSINDIPSATENVELPTLIEIPSQPNYRAAIEEVEALTEQEMLLDTEIEEEPFTFINKTNAQQSKIQERRNKLKEFNSRYQPTENENDFENVPAFRRKNIQINHDNASEQKISSFLSENENGEPQVRENRFLNKDVD